MPKRLERVNQLIKEELSQVILKEVEFPPKFLVTVTRVETSPNLIESKVFISVLPEDKSGLIFKTLNRKIYFIQQKINKRLKMRPVPQIKFFEEKETLRAGRIEELLEEIKKNR